MIEQGSMAFLQQAHRNNWQQYLSSLKPGAPGGWDVCVITAGDTRQAAFLRRQLEWRRAAGLLPAATRFMVVPDPERGPMGSGGATLRVLALLAAGSRSPDEPMAAWDLAGQASSAADDLLAGRRVLLIHSGGSARRLPHCMPGGRLFARVPRSLPDGRASTIFDEYLIGLSGLAASSPPGVLVVAGDVLLVFDHLQLSLRRSGVIGVAAAAPASFAQRHGVYVGSGEGAGGNEGRRLRAYLHNPSPAELDCWGAIDGAGRVQIDTGLLWWDIGAARKLVRLAAQPVVTATSLSLYGDLLLPLAPSSSFEAYLAMPAGLPAAASADPQLQAARRALWEGLRDIPLTAERLQPAAFAYFGSSEEYWQMAAGDERLAWLCGWAPEAASWLAPEFVRPAPELLPQPAQPAARLVAINSAVEAAAAGSAIGRAAASALPGAEPYDRHLADGQDAAPVAPALVIDSLLTAPLQLDGPAIVSGLHSALPLNLRRAGIVLYQAPLLGGGFVTCLLGLHDDPRQVWLEPRATFINHAWPVWLADARGAGPVGAPAEKLLHELLAAVWPGLPPGERSLWNAHLFPVAAGRDESLALSLPLQEPANAPSGWHAAWLGATRLALADLAAAVDGERLIEEEQALEDHIAARRFCAAIHAEQPALAAARALGSAPGAIERRAGLVATWLDAAGPLVRIRAYKGLAHATGDDTWEDRAFATLAALIQASLGRPAETGPRQDVRAHLRPGPALRQNVLPPSVRVSAAARLDFGGGWTDTPPHSLERGGTVLNAALTLRGCYPVVCDARWLDAPRLVLDSTDLDATLEPLLVGEVLDYANPADPFALVKAALVLRGIVPADADPARRIADLPAMAGPGGCRGLRLRTSTSIPRGSGLGTSSIMAGAVLACLATLDAPALEAAEDSRERESGPALPIAGSVNLPVSPARLFDEVLCLEQMLTTGGGWQDQVGGLTGGIKLIQSAPGLPQRIRVQPLHLAPAIASELAERLALVYTGQQRLAKNLLRAVMARWTGREAAMVWILANIAQLALAMQRALDQGDVDGFGALLAEHWALNKRMDPGCSNIFIDELFEVMAPLICGGKLAGAGGGGFAMVVLKGRDGPGRLQAELSARYPGTLVAIWPCALPAQGMTVELVQESLK